jgi:ABC-type transporter Mla subunit MlaD
MTTPDFERWLRAQPDFQPQRGNRAIQAALKVFRGRYERETAEQAKRFAAGLAEQLFHAKQNLAEFPDRLAAAEARFDLLSAELASVTADDKNSLNRRV